MFQLIIIRITLRLRFPISRHAFGCLYNQASLGENCSILVHPCLLEEDFTILSSEYGDYEKRGKWSVSTLMWDHRVFGSFPRLVISKGSAGIIPLYISHKTEESLFDLLSHGFRQKGSLKGEHVLAQGKGRRFLPSIC